TNETGFRGRSRAVYHREVSEAVRRARAMCPDASCVIVGPSDWPERGPGGERRARARTVQVIEVQREVAREHGCGHFDLVALQGGPGSMPRWVRAGLALPDHVHFSDRGHRAIARELERALVPG
ncbi:MAG TPA: hypothetical protein ENK57_14200, partial [Polyangiaceae bacterium]|nr:hypothetical protein [Polyangiaceae bacterium]